MSQVIIYKQDSGIIAVIHPSIEALSELGITAIAQKDVPTGKPYKIVDSSTLPDRSTRDTWTIADSELTDGVGA